MIILIKKIMKFVYSKVKMRFMRWRMYRPIVQYGVANIGRNDWQPVWKTLYYREYNPPVLCVFLLGLRSAAVDVVPHSQYSGLEPYGGVRSRQELERFQVLGCISTSLLFDISCACKMALANVIDVILISLYYLFCRLTRYM